MKKICLYTLVILTTLLGCRKEDDPVFPKSADERLNEVLTAYRTQLTGAQYGWKAMLFPKEGGYFFHFKFSDKDVVDMLSDVDPSTTYQANQSTWRLKALQRPALMFDTYSYLHLLSDPNPNMYGGEQGKGFYSDFEFSFESASPDTIHLSGNFNGSELVLIRATKEEEDAYNAEVMSNIMQATNAYNSSHAFPYLKMSDGRKLATSININTKVFSASYLDEKNEIVTLNSAFLFTTKGIYLKDPIKYGNDQFHELLWDAVKKTYYIMVGTTRIDMENSATAIIPLYMTMGVDYSAMVVLPDPLPGQSPDFVSAYQEAVTGIDNSGYNIHLKNIFYKFDKKKKTMVINIRLWRGTIQYIGNYSFDWAMDANGISSFVFTNADGNAGLIQDEMLPLLIPMISSSFKMDFFNAGGDMLGGMYSLDDPGFFFTGILIQ
jgi:hypothetical protein